MSVQPTSVRIDTLSYLYHRLADDQLADEAREILEAALDLTLNDRRQADSVIYLRRNVLRNAKFTVMRGAKSRREAARQRPLPDPTHRRITWRDEIGITHATLIDHATPESYAIAAETLRELQQEAQRLGSYGQACFEGLLKGATAAETAGWTGVSTATVERCWRKLRIHAQTLLTITE